MISNIDQDSVTKSFAEFFEKSIAAFLEDRFNEIISSK